MIKKIITIYFVIISFAAVAIASNIQTNQTVKLEVTNAWARSAISPNTNSAIYMTLKNNDTKDYEIIGVSAMLIANRVELHDSYLDDAKISRMRPVDKIIIPAANQIELKPGGTHIMLMDLKQDLKAGDKFTIKLKIQNVGLKDVEVEVKAPNTSGN